MESIVIIIDWLSIAGGYVCSRKPTQPILSQPYKRRRLTKGCKAGVAGRSKALQKKIIPAMLLAFFSISMNLLCDFMYVSLQCYSERGFLM